MPRTPDTNPRLHLKSALRLLLALAGTLAVASTATPAEPPPNVVLIVADDQSWTDFGFMGHEAIQTPHIDRIAAEGLTFTRGYVPGSLCRCSLASLVTGLYPHQHRITSNDPAPGADRADMLVHIQQCDTVPRLLSGLGYVSLQTGKWWEGSFALGGFTHGMTHGDPARGGRHGDEGLAIGREGLQPIFDFIEARGGRPFFVWYAPFMPHEPHTPPQRILEKYEQPGRSPHVARYWAMCEWFDETVGDLLSYLDSAGLEEDTLVAFITDNGWIQNPDGRGFAPKSKRSPYDGGLRTPIILRWPGTIAPRLDSETNVTSLDLVATLLAACGASSPRDATGMDLLVPLVQSRDAIFGEIFTHDAVDIHDPASSLLYRWCIQSEWKLILPSGGEARPELYNLQSDPHEESNLADLYPDRVAGMTARIETWWPGR